MIQNSINKLFFLDCETVPVVEDFYTLPDRLADIWAMKQDKEGHDDYSASFNDQAGLQAEFGKVCCISFGYFKDDTFRVKSICGEDEVAILKEFALVVDTLKGYSLAGHNISGFDIPFLAKRYLINGLPIPLKLNHTGVKPWDLTDVDSMVLWKFGNFQAKYVSLDLLTAVFGIESPKGGMDGSKVREAFYAGKLKEISTYCNQDVIASARVLQKFMGLPLVDNSKIEVV